MRILPIQEIYSKKFAHQKNLSELEYHASGHCVHIGKLSPGCHGCFVPSPFSYNLKLGTHCNLDCDYCPGTGREENTDGFKKIKAEMVAKALTQDLSQTIPRLSFSGGGEPLMHLDVITDFVTTFQSSIAKHMNKKPWLYLYTNGVFADDDALLRLKDLGFNEIRFHLGASNFSKQVYTHMKNAVQCINVVTVETPAWPLHRTKLFEMLPLIEDIGVKHLNIGEVMITRSSYERVARLLPDAELYQCYEIHLYDNGLVYDIIEEVLRRNFSYSVLDCSGFVKSIQRAPGKWIAHEDVAGLCTGYE